ncbi:MAG: hypothetical protein RIC19_24590 [Phaeodactylibacter sp.]|uniref:hypothetical protein n=1 Tax=Phaeodactylibacter sp. TaxID=1940289 RepID=UPI0032EE6D26
MNKLPFFVALAFLIGCAGEPKSGSETETEDLETALPGTWESVSLRVDINTVDGTDTSYVFEVREEEWVQRLGVKPVRTYYKTDNKYDQVFTSMTDTILSTTRGMWNIFGDTLMMVEPNATYHYEAVIENGLITLKAQLDWDGDGEADDDYLGVHRKVSSATE